MAELRIEVDGEGGWTTEDYTLDEMSAVEGRTRLLWPHVLIGAGRGEAEQVRALIIQHFLRSEPDEAAAAKRAGALTRKQYAVAEVEEDDRPVEYDDGIPVVDPPRAAAG